MRILVFALAIMLCTLPFELRAQTNATLIADHVQINGNNSITATGNVEVFYDGAHLRAKEVTYFAKEQHLEITGPIHITYVDGTTIIADAAELDADLRNGILQSARIVLGQQLQIAATEINRVNGRYMQISKSVASSCKICNGSTVPLWEIRAKRIIHDQLERQLYFEGAQLRLANIPVFYLPRLRLPDPTLDRARGFLIPTASSDSNLGTGIKMPYFIAIGPSADVTLTPYLTERTNTVELRYRQAFQHGNLNVEGAISKDDISSNGTRAYVFAEGQFRMPQDFLLNLNLQLTSDNAYLSDYDYSDTDRLESAIELTRTQKHQFFSARYSHFHSFRDSENNDTIPSEVADLNYERRFALRGIGGMADFKFDLHGHQRNSAADGIDGRDIGRISTAIDWNRDWLMHNGMIAKITGALNADYYGISSDSAYPTNQFHVTPTAAVELRWPFQKQSASGASHVLEPIVQLVWTDTSAANVPNEDSTLVEFDEGNLFAFTRYPGQDRYERGLRANLGISWTRYDPSGWSLGLTVGRVIRADDLSQFSLGTGLSGQQSDWLAAVQVKLPENLTLTNRALFNDQFSFTKNETLLSWQSDRLALATGYIWMVPESQENRPNGTSEWTMDAVYRMSRHWTGSADWRYDFDAGQAARAGLGLEYQNECLRMGFSLSRRFTSSTSVEPTTRVGFKIALLGFGTAGNGQDYARSCSRVR